MSSESASEGVFHLVEIQRRGLPHIHSHDAVPELENDIEQFQARQVVSAHSALMALWGVSARQHLLHFGLPTLFITVTADPDAVPTC